MRNQVVVDCGATHHMFNSPRFFPNSFKEIRSQVATGDAQRNLLACGIDTSFSLSSKEKVILQGEICDRLMYITYDFPQTLLTLGNSHLWHCRLGHPGRTVLRSLGLPDQEHSCLTCQTNKSHQLPFLHHFEPARYPLDTVHIDLVGPITSKSISGFQLLLTIVDQATSFKIVKFLKRKSDSFDQFVITKNYMENWHERKSKKLVSDRGGEFHNEKFKDLSNECGFIHTLSSPETPEHNRYAERANRTVLEKARCLMNHANLPNQYWAEEINTAAVIHNLKRQQDWKLAPPGQEGVLLGFENGDTAYQILRLSDLTVLVTRNVTFNEEIFPTVANGRTSSIWNVEEPTLEPETDPTSTLNDPVPVDQQQPENNVRLRIIGPRHPTLINSDVDPSHILPYSRRARAFVTTSDIAPRTYRLALQCEDRTKWMTAIESELSEMNKLKVWDIVKLKSN
ncbi:hypothetical protein O181_111382 [Austropuccinia psidii MF-1]|uniref:Integrase catalytic domain-containing protein n=1 Tax=Austropuccinia psidii MF-1 TaxID=1389203 RepID=A0A9Q3K1N9_9BASI|nr:hypothetical protein [Austropuccinia psidii MF-1]